MSKIYKKKKKYLGFTIVEMLITMAVLMILFLAIGSVITNMLVASNTISSRMIVREEGEYLAEVFRKYVRNSSADGVKLYSRDDPLIEFNDDWEVKSIQGDYSECTSSCTEIHFRPTGESANKVVCFGFFEDDDGIGYLVRSVNELSGNWGSYDPETCFPSSPSANQIFRKNFVVLNSDLVYIDGLKIEKTETSSNVYYSFDIDMRPYWGLGGMSNYRSLDGSPKYRKSFVVQTRQIFYW